MPPDPEDEDLLESESERTAWEYSIDPEMIWATRTGPDEIKVYLNETEALTFDNDAARAVLKALINVLGQDRK